MKMNKLLAVALAFIMAASSPIAVCAEEVVGISETEAGVSGTEVLSEDETSAEDSETESTREPEAVSALEGQEKEETPEMPEQTELEEQEVPEGQEVIEVHDALDEAAVGADVSVQKYGVNFSLSNAQLAGKRALYQAINSLEGAVPGRDYLKNQIVVEAANEGQASEIAKGFDGELLSYQDGIAVIETKMSTYEAVVMSADMAVKLPAAYPNYWYTADDGKRYEAVDSADEFSIDFKQEDFPDLKNSINAISAGQFDVKVKEEGLPETMVSGEFSESMTGAAAASVNDPDIGKQWFHQVIDTFNAWKVTKGAGVKVAVIDSGIKEDHVEFAGRVTAVDKVTAVSSLNGAEDNVGHGTHVAGIIGAAADNGEGGVGVAPEVEILSLKALEIEVDQAGYATATGSTADIAAAVNYAVNEGAKVINMSLGGPMGFEDALYQKAIDAATAKGIVVVAAAGNESLDISKEDYKVVPACLNGVITVASLERSGSLSFFSNYGAIDVSAPGGSSIYRDDPNDIYSTSIVDGGYQYMSGTSMACPVVTGVVALIIASGSYEANEKGAKAIANTLKSSCVNIGNAKSFGAGRVNAAAAVQAVSIYSKTDTFNVVAGKSLKLQAVTGNKVAKPVWTITGEAAGCTISKSGTFKAAKAISEETTVNVTATCGDKSDTVAIMVYPKAGTIASNMRKKAVTLHTNVLRQGNSFELEYESIKFDVTSSFPCTYKSSNNRVAVVDADGIVYGLSNGKATITATTVGGKKATLKVKVTGTPYFIDKVVPSKNQHKSGAAMFADSYLGRLLQKELKEELEKELGEEVKGTFVIYPVSVGKSEKFIPVASWPYNTASSKKVRWTSTGGTVKNGSLKMRSSGLGEIDAAPVSGIGEMGTLVYSFKAMDGFHFGTGGGKISADSVKSTTSVKVPAGGTSNVEYSVLVPLGTSSRGLNPYPYIESSDDSIAVGVFDEEYEYLRIKVIGKKPGKCKLTMISMDGAYKKATINVTVN